MSSVCSDVIGEFLRSGPVNARGVLLIGLIGSPLHSENPRYNHRDTESNLFIFDYSSFSFYKGLKGT